MSSAIPTVRRAAKGERLVCDTAGNFYRPVPPAALEDPRSVARQIATAQVSGDYELRNRLMAYAHARGASIRQLGDLCGLTSTSTVSEAIHRASSGDLGVLGDECPEGLR